ncbi:hydroxymethylbilane synthase [Thermobifida halotolerans]|uniref:Hydroxymethylbilane synthase n=2 Tax=Thermobifida halotolerans TaxID=483545 RepID=A0A399G0F3_9ACTN|nr:hydroxymethylbilane synthase [Thermobifida halotolerans]UOE19254.1 hydroxymethylbilane synthase [Thermobifida halotolerans]
MLPVEQQRLRIGTRISPTARVHALQVRDLLAKALPEVSMEIIPVETAAERRVGGFASLHGRTAAKRELDRRLLSGQIDLAVHWMKEVPSDSTVPEGITFGAYIRREDIHDVVVFRAGSPYRSLAELPEGAAVGVPSVHRCGQLLRHRPDLHVLTTHGDADSQIDTLDAQDEYEAVVVARSEIARPHPPDDRAVQTLDLEVMCPPVGAAAIGVACRIDDVPLADLLYTIDDPVTRSHITAERTLQHGLKAHYDSPIAGHCRSLPDGKLSLRGMVFTRDGKHMIEVCEQDAPNRPTRLGTRVAAALLSRGVGALIGN